MLTNALYLSNRASGYSSTTGKLSLETQKIRSLDLTCSSIKEYN